MKDYLKGIGIIFLAMILLVSCAGAAPFAYVTDGNSVNVADVATSSVVTTIDMGSSSFGIAANPAGTNAYVTHYDSANTLSVIDTATNTVSATIDLGSGCRYVAISPDGKKAYVTHGTFSNTVSVVDTATKTLINTIDIGTSAEGIAFTPDGSKIYLACQSSIVVIDATKDTVLANIPAAEGFYPRCVAVNPAGTNAYVTNQRDSANVAGSMSIIDVSTDTIVGTVEVGDNPLGITISPDGSKIYVVNLMNHQVSVINAGTNTIENTITVSSHPTQAAITADGSKLLVTASVDGYVDVVDTGTNSIIGDIGMSSPIGIVIVSPPSVALKVNDFTADVVSGTDPLTVHFTSDTSGNPNKWIWTFGKSSEETYKVGTVTHVFKQPGTYDVTLTIKNKSGQAMMTKKGFITVQRLKPPKASFIVDSAAGTAPLIVHFSDTSSNGPVKWLWSFGDGEFALIQNPIHKYDRPGKYTVTLLVENKAGIDAKIERGFITVVAKRR